MPRWIWSISECNLTTRDSPKRTLRSGPFVVLKGVPTRSMENMKWHSASQVLTAKHVPYPQLTATVAFSVSDTHVSFWKNPVDGEHY